MKRVAITGVGVVSSLGQGRDNFSRRLREGRSAIGPLTTIPVDTLQIKIGAEVADFNPLAHFSEKQLGLMDRVSQFAVVAAREAIALSGLDFRTDLGHRAAAILGTGVGGMNTLDDGFNRLYARGAQRLPPFTVPKLMPSAAASHVSMDSGIRGPAFVITSACASANHAIGMAFQMVRSGMVEAAVTGGTEACLTYGTIRAWEAIRILSPDTCQPFSRDRKGLVLGEGAAMLVLEDHARATARGAEILGEILGFGMTADAADLVMPSEEGAAGAIAACLSDARLNPDSIEYVNAHGTATAVNDVIETRALHRVFGAHAVKLAVSSTKSLHAHALGAAGALELVATVMAMKDGFIPPTANFTKVDPQCDLDYVPNTAREKKVRVAISNSFAFGGLNAVLAVGGAG